MRKRAHSHAVGDFLAAVLFSFSLIELFKCYLFAVRGLCQIQPTLPDLQDRWDV